MSFDNKKLKLALLTLFLGAWIFGVGQLGLSHFDKGQVKKIETTSMSSSSSTTEAMKNKSLILTGIVGVFHYFYKK